MGSTVLPIERAGQEDAPEILRLQKLAYVSEAALYGDDTIPPMTQTRDEIRADFETHVFLKLALEGEIIGSVRAYVQGDCCHVERLIVHPGFQNRGLGTRLTRAVEDYFPAAARFELFTGHRSERNLRLYQKLGYAPVRRQEVTPGLTFIYLEKVNPRRQP